MAFVRLKLFKMQREKKNELMVFEFSETKTPIRNILVDGEPYFVGSDVAKVLGYKEPHKAVTRICRYGTKHPIPHPQNNDKSLLVSIIPESDVYRLIIKSELPAAEKFERWVMEEVLPSIRKRGYFNAFKVKDNDFIDMRMEVHQLVEFNGCQLRVLSINEILWTSLNDYNRAVQSRTNSNQQSKSLGGHAQKIWIRGNTKPAWFADPLGIELLMISNKTYNTQLKLSI